MWESRSADERPGEKYLESSLVYTDMETTDWRRDEKLARPSIS
jgi:hypothetical protein